MKLSRLFRSPVAIVAAAVIVSGSVFAFAAQMTSSSGALPGSTGAGQMKVSANGYQIDNIQFVPYLDGGSNTAKARITFELYQPNGVNAAIGGTEASATTDVSAKFITSQAKYWACAYTGDPEGLTEAAKATWQCDAKQDTGGGVAGLLDLNEVQEFNVVALERSGVNPGLIEFVP